jgi:serine phosphatase RsbU (regulator of sigma subunit)/CHASE3 domain sensor protein
MLRASSIPLVILFLAVPLMILTSWYTHVTLARGAETQRLFRDLQYERTRLGLLQVDEETALRGYVITGDRRFLDPLTNSQAAWPGMRQALRYDLDALGRPHDLLDAMEQLHGRWFATVAAPLIANRHRGDALALEYRGKDLMDAFRRDQIAFRESTVEQARLADRRLGRSIDLTLTFGAATTVAFLLIGLASGIYQTRATERVSRLRTLYENEKRIADSLQEAFLQRRLPSSPELKLHAKYVPAASQALVGGDWYDAFGLPDGRILFSIGDVAGHGIEAAVAMSRARQAIIAAALQEGDPAMVLARANASIALQDGRMVTAICGFIDPTNHETVYATAGHPAPVLARASGRAAFLPHEGLPLGIFPETPYRTFVAHAGAGDLLVLYTDGLIEHNHDVLAGEARLIEAAESVRTASEPAEELYRAVFAADVPADDVAILTISFNPAAQGSELPAALEAPRDASDAGKAGGAQFRVQGVHA